MDEGDLSCLKAIILFNPDIRGLSPNSRPEIEMCREKVSFLTLCLLFDIDIQCFVGSDRKKFVLSLVV